MKGVMSAYLQECKVFIPRSYLFWKAGHHDYHKSQTLSDGAHDHSDLHVVCSADQRLASLFLCHWDVGHGSLGSMTQIPDSATSQIGFVTWLRPQIGNCHIWKASWHRACRNVKENLLKWNPLSKLSLAVPTMQLSKSWGWFKPRCPSPGRSLSNELQAVF